MVLKAMSSITQFGGSRYIRIPHTILKDSQFPFKNEIYVMMEVHGSKLIVSEASYEAIREVADQPKEEEELQPEESEEA